MAETVVVVNPLQLGDRSSGSDARVASMAIDVHHQTRIEHKARSVDGYKKRKKIYL